MHRRVKQILFVEPITGPVTLSTLQYELRTYKRTQTQSLRLTSLMPILSWSFRHANPIDRRDQKQANPDRESEVDW